jgi:hypothetical protein
MHAKPCMRGGEVLLARVRKILKMGALLGVLLFVMMQMLNVRTPITIETAQATETSSGIYRVYGHTNASYVSLRLTKPNGSYMYTQSDGSGNFAFVGNEESDFPDGTYGLRASKLYYTTVSKSFNLNVEMGARAEVTMIPVWFGNSYIAIQSFMPWY